MIKRSPNGHIVGNGGHAVVFDGTLYSRDLFEAGLIGNAYVGSNADPAFIEFVEHWAFTSLPLDRDQLAQKLSDLNLVAPNFGHYVVKALSLYTWLASPAALPSTNECDDTRPTRDDLIQVAVRTCDSITIHIESWNRLSRTHQVALLIHEAVYSMLKPVRVSENLERQHGPVARKIAALLFNKNLYEKNAVTLAAWNDIKTQLNIPSMNSAHGEPHSQAKAVFKSYTPVEGYTQFAVQIEA